MKEYKLITEFAITKFEKEIEQHLKNGWKLQGGVSATQCGYETKYVQAMVKDKNENI